MKNLTTYTVLLGPLILLVAFVVSVVFGGRYLVRHLVVRKVQHLPKDKFFPEWALGIFIHPRVCILDLVGRSMHAPFVVVEELPGSRLRLNSEGLSYYHPGIQIAFETENSERHPVIMKLKAKGFFLSQLQEEVGAALANTKIRNTYTWSEDEIHVRMLDLTPRELTNFLSRLCYFLYKSEELLRGVDSVRWLSTSMVADLHEEKHMNMLRLAFPGLKAWSDEAIISAFIQGRLSIKATPECGDSSPTREVYVEILARPQGKGVPDPLRYMSRAEYFDQYTSLALSLYIQLNGQKFLCQNDEYYLLDGAVVRGDHVLAPAEITDLLEKIQQEVAALSEQQDRATANTRELQVEQLKLVVGGLTQQASA